MPADIDSSFAELASDVQRKRLLCIARAGTTQTIESKEGRVLKKKYKSTGG